MLKFVVKRCHCLHMGQELPAREGEKGKLAAELDETVEGHQAYFFFRLYREAEKVQSFYFDTLEDLTTRTNALSEAVDAEPLMRRKPQNVARLVAAGEKIKLLLEKFDQYCHLNAEALRKILKKFDKRMGTAALEQLDSLTYVLSRVEVQGLIETVDGCMHLLHNWDEDLYGMTNQEEISAAVLNDDVEAIQKMLESKLPVKPQDLHDLFQLACVVNAFKVVEWVFGLGFDVTWQEPVSGLSALHVVVQHNWPHSLSLISKKFPKELPQACNLLDTRGNSPLHVAARSNSQACVPLLLEQGALVNQLNNKGMCPLAVAIQNESLEVALCLLDNPDIDLLWAHPDTGETFAMIAARKGIAQLLRVLVERVASVDAVSAAGETALHLACARGCSTCTEILIPVSNLDAQTNYWRNSPMIEAARVNAIECVKLLIDAGASARLHDFNGWTALTHAVYHGRTELEAILVEAAPPPPISDMVRLQDIRPWTFIDKQGTQRARGHEKVVSISEKEFGHNYLRGRQVVVDVQSVVMNMPVQHLKLRMYVAGQNSHFKSVLLPWSDTQVRLFS